jgi:CheY-like chemotaxis protein
MRTILLVEDTPGDAAQLQQAVRQAGLSVRLEVVGDGAEAMVYLEGRGEYSDRERYPLPALLLLDLAMPRRSGIEVLSWLQGQPQLERLPVVVLTASRERDNIALAFELGARSYLVKPVAPEALAEVVNTHILPLDRPLDILIVGDKVDQCEQIDAELRRELSEPVVKAVTTPSELLNAVDAGGFDAVVTTWSAAGGTGVDVLRAVKARWPDCPVVLLAGSLGARDLQEALRSGLDDCVLDAPEHILRLPAAVLTGVGRALQRRALRAAEARYRTLVEQIPAITYTASLQGVGRMVFVSPQVERLGYSVEEVQADSRLFLGLVHPDD